MQITILDKDFQNVGVIKNGNPYTPSFSVILGIAILRRALLPLILLSISILAENYKIIANTSTKRRIFIFVTREKIICFM